MANKNNETMKPVNFKEGCETLWQSLGIDEERAGELEYRFKLIIHEVQRPVKNPEDSPSSDTMIKMFLALAQDQQELVLCSYIAGIQTTKLYNTEEEEDIWEEWDGSQEENER